MIALAVIISMIAMFWLGKIVGRQEATVAVMEIFAKLYKGLSAEDKLLFDKWMQDFKKKEEE